MDKQKLNYWVDAVALISFLTTSISGLAIYFFMPRGVRRGGLQDFLGIEKDSWSSFHEITGIVFFLAVVVHLILHHQWISCMTKNMFKEAICEKKDEKNK